MFTINSSLSLFVSFNPNIKNFVFLLHCQPSFKYSTVLNILLHFWPRFEKSGLTLIKSNILKRYRRVKKTKEKSKVLCFSNKRNKEHYNTMSQLCWIKSMLVDIVYSKTASLPWVAIFLNIYIFFIL